MPHLQLAAVAHPIGGIDPKLVRAKAETIVDRVLEALTRDPSPPLAASVATVRAVAAPGDLDAFQDFAVAEGWSDGLPVLPPTEERVGRILGRLAGDRTEVIATLVPRQGVATLEAIAVNAALAGALPEHLPVVVAAIRALADPRFNLNAIQTTTHPCTPLLIVSDPGSTTAEALLFAIAGTAATTGSNNIYLGGEPLVVLGPEHAQTFATGGWSKADVKRAIWERARVRLDRFSPENRERFAVIDPARFRDRLLADEVALCASPDDQMVIVAGGPGKHSAIIPTFGATRAVTVRIEE